MTNVTGELPSVEDTIDTMKDDGEAQMRVAVSTLKAALNAPGTEAGESVAWQVAVQTILTARPVA